MSFFKPTQEEINKAMKGKGGNPDFKHDEEVHFTIMEAGEKEIKGNMMMVVKCSVDNTEHKGQDYTHFIRNNEFGKELFIRILKAFYDDATIMSGSLSPASIVGKRMKSVAKHSKSGDKVYINFYQFSELSDVPNIGGDSGPSASDIPF